MHAKNRSHDPTGRKKNFKGKQKLTPASQKKGTKQEPKSREPATGDKSTEATPNSKPGAQKPPPANPSKESALEDGSLLSMVSSCAVDLTVAASEKVSIYELK